MFSLVLSLLFSSSVGWTDDRIVANVSVRNNQGTVYCLLFQSKEGFPHNFEKAVARVSGKPKNKLAKCEFPGLMPGEYAITTFHDEKGKGKLHRNFLGIPKEGVGTSNDAKMRRGPPKFKDARFDYEGKIHVLQIHIKYR